MPFRLPLPIDAANGDCIVPCEQEDGTAAFATLFHLLPGHLPDHAPERHDLTIASNAAIVLAQLDQAFAHIPEPSVTADMHLLPRFGDLTRVHPLAADPVVVLEQLPVEREQVRKLQEQLTSLLEKIPLLYQRLPQQLLHRDYDPANILVEGSQVTAVLDFEFAGVDLRVIDLAVALSWWPVRVMGTGQEWEILDAFGSTYLAHFPLSPEELESLPDIFRLRDAISLVKRVGSYLAGQVTVERIRDRVAHSLWREAWLTPNEEKLVDYASHWA